MRKQLSIIAIDPGVRETGVAHFEGDELVDYGIKSLRRPGNFGRRLKLLRTILGRVLDEKRPDVIVFERNWLGRTEPNEMLLKAIDQIRKLARQRDVLLSEFAPSTIKKTVASDGRASKRQVAKSVCAVFPELQAYRGSKTKWRERYYQNLFDAVACGLTYLKHHGKGTPKT